MEMLGEKKTLTKARVTDYKLQIIEICMSKRHRIKLQVVPGIL